MKIILFTSFYMHTYMSKITKMSSIEQFGNFAHLFKIYKS